MIWVGIAMLGAAGAVARAALERWSLVRSPAPAFPHGILLVNVSGSLALGLLVGLGAHGALLKLLGVALLGSFTTFSTWILDSVTRPARVGLANIVVSLALGLCGVWLGRLA